jgi:hypothetical protein
MKLAGDLVDSSVLSWPRKVYRPAFFAGLTIKIKVIGALCTYWYIRAYKEIVARKINSISYNMRGNLLIFQKLNSAFRKYGDSTFAT